MASLPATLAFAALLLGPTAASAHHHPEPDALRGADSCPVCVWQQHYHAEPALTPAIDGLSVDRQGPPLPAMTAASAPSPQPAARAPPASVR